MIYKKFWFRSIVRILLLVLTIFVFFYTLSISDYYITPVLIAVAIVYQTYSLVYYVEKTNRDLTNFLESIRFADFTRSFHPEGLGKSFDNLADAFNNVLTDFRKIRSEKEEHYFYSQNIIQHIGIAIIAYQRNGKVEMINNAAKKLFQISNLKNIQTISSWSKDLVEVLERNNPGENALVKVQDYEDILQLSVYTTEFKLENRIVILASIKNIQTELEEQEMEAWQKLIRVLTHEIMNSIAPIASLSSITNQMVKDIYESFEQDATEQIDRETIADIQDALETIHKRSTGLIHFVETYRNLTRIPKPNFTIFSVNDLLYNIYKLFEKKITSKQIEYTTIVEPLTLKLTADEQLIEQVIINMIQNSIHAVENSSQPKIEIQAFVNKRERVTILIKDNGQGIIKEVRDKIFIPFFTTKSNGSGIGLSLSKQILRLHNGSITVQSKPDVETCFTLTF